MSKNQRHRRGCYKVWKYRIVLVIERRQSDIYSFALVRIRKSGSCLQYYVSMWMCFTRNFYFSKPSSVLSYTSSFIWWPQTAAHLLMDRKTSLKIFRTDSISSVPGHPQYQEKFIFYLYQLFFIFPGEVTCSVIAAATTRDILRDDQEALRSSECWSSSHAILPTDLFLFPLLGGIISSQEGVKYLACHFYSL